ncbi:MAG: DUF2784 family protein [Patescibacteria group bacterium]
MKQYKLLADIIAFLHLIFTIAVAVSLVVALLTPHYRPLAFFLSAILLTSWKIWGDCPFARWENHFRRRYNPRTAYRRSFLEHYSHKYLPFTIRDAFIKTSAFAILVVLIILTVT